jgi:hypothetical protein
MSNDFLQFDVNKNNIMNNSDYLNSTHRKNGVYGGAGGAPSILHNKLFYQLSTMVAALGEALSGKGYTVSDVDIDDLMTVLQNIMTEADMGNYPTYDEMVAYVNSHISTLSFPRSLNVSGYQSIPSGTVAAPLIMQWAVGVWDPANSSELTQTIVFPIAFPTTCLFAEVSTQIESASIYIDHWYQSLPPERTYVTVQRQRHDIKSYAVRTRPVVTAFGY